MKWVERIRRGQGSKNKTDVVKIMHGGHRNKPREVFLDFKDIVQGSLKRRLKKVNVFLFAHIGLYEIVLHHVFGPHWRNGKYSLLIQNEQDLSNKKTIGERTLIVIPIANTNAQFNKLVSQSLFTGNPVWVVGYPTILQKPLWAHFQGFILFRAPTEELELLQEVMGITKIRSLYLERGEHVLGLVALFSVKKKIFYFFDQIDSLA